MVGIDTGEHYRGWTQRIVDFYAEWGRPTSTSRLITHGHGDQIGGVDRLQEAMACPVRCHPKLAPRLGRILDPDVVIKLRSRESVRTGGGVGLRALFTPGHEVDHVCYYLARDRVLFTGDLVLGGSTTSVQDLGAYMNSLDLLTGYSPSMVCPAHGPLVPNGPERIRMYIRHRNGREQQIVAALETGITGLDDIVTAIYPPNLRRGLRGAAARAVRTHLAKLKDEGRVTEQSPQYTIKAQ